MREDKTEAQKKGTRRYWRLGRGWENASKCLGFVQMRDADGEVFDALCSQYHAHAVYELFEDKRAIGERSAIEHLKETRPDLRAEQTVRAGILAREKKQAEQVVKMIETGTGFPFPELLDVQKRVRAELEKLLPAESAPVDLEEKAKFAHRRRRLLVSIWETFALDDRLELVGSLEPVPLPSPSDDIPF